ncbi:hypothetical protein AYO21_02247 [Fonsecaea monophora]|uniref:Uncharacterized protein n=1 Tax=Fonsecaea monophora TaxID=254056 RepID=A0A177FIS3_9EURO|nr:hypothetical protein AYO21_02247 [Fonsecaea monophora]OAG43661.1 hypothetical protein AYO21_02247 [Fonsecaea monophora]
MSVGEFPVKGKIVVVTGGGSGICLAFVKLAVQQGAQVLIGDLKLGPEAAAFATSAGPDVVKFVKCDVTDWRDLENLIVVSEREFGDVPDVYVPGAGVFEPYAQLDINLAHPIKLTRLAIRALVGRNKKGVVCCIASIGGLDGQYAATLYSACKHGVVGLVKSLGDADPEEGVKVVGICPGETDTDDSPTPHHFRAVWTPLWTDRPEKMEQYSVASDLSQTPEEVAQLMLDLVQDAKYTGGTVLRCDKTRADVVYRGVTESSAATSGGLRGKLIKGSYDFVRRILRDEREGGKKRTSQL